MHRPPIALAASGALLSVLAPPTLPQATCSPPAEAGIQEQVLAPSGAAGGDGVSLNDDLGEAVAVDGEWAVVTAFRHNHAGVGDSGGAWVYRRVGSSWIEYQELVPTGSQAPQTGDKIGFSAAIDADSSDPGDWTIVVGAPQAPSGQATGEAHVFAHESSSGSWVYATTLTAPTPGNNDHFGHGVAVDGDTIVVTNNPNNGSGSGYVYERPAGGWSAGPVLAGTLVPDNSSAADRFGSDVAIEGELVVIGAYYAERIGGGSADVGAAYLFERPAGGWQSSQQQRLQLVAANGHDDMRFGHSVALSGSTVVVGAQQADSPLPSAGAAYVFEQPAGGWSAVAPTMTETCLLAPAALVPNARFGWSVALQQDRLAVGASFQDSAPGLHSGAVFVYQRSSQGCWSELGRLWPEWPEQNAEYGYSVAIEGELVLVGAQNQDSLLAQDSGAVHVHAILPPAGTPSCHCAVGVCNNADASAGCLTASGCGARLLAFGSTSPDELNLYATGAPAGQPGILFQGDQLLAGGGVPFGDGYRCVAPPHIRLSVPPVITDAHGSVRFGPRYGGAPISILGGVSVGSTKAYQFWFRDPLGFGACNGLWNLSNALEIGW